MIVCLFLVAVGLADINNLLSVPWGIYVILVILLIAHLADKFAT